MNEMEITRNWVSLMSDALWDRFFNFDNEDEVLDVLNEVATTEIDRKELLILLDNFIDTWKQVEKYERCEKIKRIKEKFLLQ